MHQQTWLLFNTHLTAGPNMLPALAVTSQTCSASCDESSHSSDTLSRVEQPQLCLTGDWEHPSTGLAAEDVAQLGSADDMTTGTQTYRRAPFSSIQASAPKGEGRQAARTRMGTTTTTTTTPHVVLFSSPVAQNIVQAKNSFDVSDITG